MIESLKGSKDFLQKILVIALPIFLQSFITSILNFIDLFMIGQLGENEIAAVGIGNQIYFLYIMLIFSFASGVSVFVAQYWGKKDLDNIHKMLGIGLFFTLIISVLVTFLVVTFNKNIVSIYNKSPEVIKLASDYIGVVAFSFVVLAVSFVVSSVLRSTKNVKLPVIASLIAVAINTVLNYMMIFGHFGFPALGVKGAAIATLIARIVELAIVLAVCYIKKFDIIAPLNIIFSFTKSEVQKYLKTTLPILGQGMGWAVGASIYAVIYGNISTESFAAYNIAGSVEKIFLIVFTSLGVSCSIILGNYIGNNETNIVKDYSKKFAILTVFLALILMPIILILRNYIIDFYNIDSSTREYLQRILIVISIVLVAKANNIIFITGILKSGGDTFFTMLVDMGGVWLIGIPLAIFSAYVLKLPVYYVVAIVSIEEFVKSILCYYRYFSDGWINDLTTE